MNTKTIKKLICGNTKNEDGDEDEDECADDNELLKMTMKVMKMNMKNIYSYHYKQLRLPQERPSEELQHSD